MCLAVYAAAETDLPTVPWDEAAPRFCAEEAAPDDAVRGQFQGLRVVRSLGAHEGCGCGFVDDEDAGDREEERAAKRASLRALIEYLRAAASRSPVHVFICWEGDQAQPARQALFAALESLEDPSFWKEARAEAMAGRPMSVVIPASSSPST